MADIELGGVPRKSDEPSFGEKAKDRLDSLGGVPRRKPRREGPSAGERLEDMAGKLGGKPVPREQSNGPSLVERAKEGLSGLGGVSNREQRSRREGGGIGDALKNIGKAISPDRDAVSRASEHHHDRQDTEEAHRRARVESGKNPTRRGQLGDAVVDGTLGALGAVGKGLGGILKAAGKGAARAASDAYNDSREGRAQRSEPKVEEPEAPPEAPAWTIVEPDVPDERKLPGAKRRLTARRERKQVQDDEDFIDAEYE